MRSKIDSITTGKSAIIYRELLESLDYSSPHQFVTSAYSEYERTGQSTPSISGRIFEYLICETLAQEEIVPFYYQARFEYVPNADFDVVLYHRIKPVVLTMKVSMRERYKQSVLEGWVLWQVYKNAETFLITLHEKEAANVQRKIDAGEIVGVDGCILASTPAYDLLLEELKDREFQLAQAVMPLEGKNFPP